MKIEDEALMNYLWSWEVMRRIGFAPSEIIMAVTPPGGSVRETPDAEPKFFTKPYIACVVRRGGTEFVWMIGPTDIPLDDIAAAHDAAVDAWNSGTLEGADVDAFKKSGPFRQSTDLLIALNRKGLL